MNSYWKQCKTRNEYITGNVDDVCLSETTWTGLKKYYIGILLYTSMNVNRQYMNMQSVRFDFMSFQFKVLIGTRWHFHVRVESITFWSENLNGLQHFRRTCNIPDINQCMMSHEQSPTSNTIYGTKRLSNMYISPVQHLANLHRFPVSFIHFCQYNLYIHVHGTSRCGHDHLAYYAKESRQFYRHGHGLIMLPLLQIILSLRLKSILYFFIYYSRKQRSMLWYCF